MISTKSKFGIERYFNVEKIYEKLFWFIHLLYIVTHCEKKIKKKTKDKWWLYIYIHALMDVCFLFQIFFNSKNYIFSIFSDRFLILVINKKFSRL